MRSRRLSNGRLAMSVVLTGASVPESAPPRGRIRQAYSGTHARRCDDDSAAARAGGRPRSARADRGILRDAVHRNGPDGLPRRGRGLAGRTGSGTVHRCRRGFPAQPVRHRGHRMGAPGGHRREVPARPGHPGPHACGPSLWRGFRASRTPAAGLRAGRESLLRGIPDRHARSPRRLLRPGLHHPAVERGVYLRAGSQSRHRRGEPSTRSANPAICADTSCPISRPARRRRGARPRTSR